MPVTSNALSLDEFWTQLREMDYAPLFQMAHPLALPRFVPPRAGATVSIRPYVRDDPDFATL